MQMIGTPVGLESEARPQERAWEVSARSAERDVQTERSKGGYYPRLYRITVRMGESHCIVCGQTGSDTGKRGDVITALSGLMNYKQLALFHRG